jgi:fluoride ion exporter CrcB/FEX
MAPIGALIRYYLACTMNNLSFGKISFPMGTFAVNMAGCAIQNMVAHAYVKHDVWKDAFARRSVVLTATAIPLYTTQCYITVQHKHLQVVAGGAQTVS